MEKGDLVRVTVRLPMEAIVTATQGDKVYVTLGNGLERVCHRRDVRPCPDPPPQEMLRRELPIADEPTHLEAAEMDETLKDEPEGWYYNL